MRLGRTEVPAHQYPIFFHQGQNRVWRAASCVFPTTSVMLADFYTKPLLQQGILFKRFRAVILGYEHISSLEGEYITLPDKMNHQ